MKLALTFLVMFLVGPILFWLLARHRPSRHRIAALMVVAVVLLALAYALGSGVIPTLGSNLATGLAAVAASWLAWIVMLAYCALAAQYRLKSVAARKAILSIGAISTALPWFGIYAAHMMAEE